MQYRFADLIFDSDCRELRRGAELVALEPQVFDLLEYLIRHRDRVVSRDDLLAAVWNGRIVSESTLGARINAARAAIGDTGAEQRLIRTLPRKGLRFVGAVHEEHAMPAREAAAGRPGLGSIAGPAVPDKPSIAVLPFKNLSADPEQEYFADGITEDITMALSRFHWFFVIDRNSSFTYKGRAVEVRQVARELGVHYVLEGSVRRDSDRVRITVQLIEADAGRHVWAERYDRDLKAVFAVQDEIAETIAGAVAPEFVAAEARRAERKRPEDLDAWDHAMRGNWHLWRTDKTNHAAARQHFETALAKDPKCVAALAGLALVCSWQVMWAWEDDPAGHRRIADEMARRAVAADPNDAWAHAVLGIVAIHRRDSRENIRCCRRALDLNPNLAVAHGTLAVGLAWLGEAEEAIEHADRAQRLSPRDPSVSWWLIPRIVTAFVAERYDEFIAWARKMTEMAPEHPTGWRMLAGGLAHVGRIEEAQAAVAVVLRLAPHFSLKVARNTVAGVRPDLLDRLVDDMRKAGIPE